MNEGKRGEMKKVLLFLGIFILISSLFSLSVFAFSAPTYIDVYDYPNDNGDAVVIAWGIPSNTTDIDNFEVFKYDVNGCAGSNTSHDVSVSTSSYTWSDLTVNSNYSFKVASEGDSYNFTDCENVTTVDNIGPGAPQNVDAEDKLDDQGEEGIDITWTSSSDQGDGANDVTSYNLYSRYGSSGDYTNFGNESVDTSVDQSEWQYSSEYNDGFFDSRIVADYLGLYVPPFDTTLFYFYVSAYDGTFETQSTHVSESFNAEPWIEDMFMTPVPGTAQTGDDVNCLAFICDVNNDDITAESEFSVTHFFGQYGSNTFDANASCVDLGVLVNGVIPQYPDIIVDCNNEHDEPVHVWECISTLDNSYTYKADKLSCSMTPNDGKEDGETESYVENVGIYSINNTAPYSSGVNIDPSNPLGSSTLECDFIVNDVDSDGESVKGTPYAIQHDVYSTYKWYINNEGLNDFVLVPDKTESTLGDYFDQNDMVKCAVNLCDKDESWIDNPLCDGEGVEGSSGQEYWILSGDTCAGYMSCGLMNETQCGYADSSSWGCEWDEDYIAATAATIYGDKIGDFELDCVNNDDVCAVNKTKTLDVTVNGVVCTINFNFTSGTMNISTAVATVNNNSNGSCNGSLFGSNVTIDSYPEYEFNALKLYTNNTGSSKSIVVTGGTARDALGFEVGQQDTGTDDTGWCDGTITQSCRDLNSTDCTNSNVSEFCFEISSVLDYVNSTISVIGGNSIPQIVDYSDDSTSSEPTDVGSDTEFNVTWLDEDGSETGMMMVCPQVGGIEDYSCDNDSYCSHNVTFGDNGNFAWVYTNETDMLIDTIEIKIRAAEINGTNYTSEGNTTPFIFSLLAFEADNNTMNNTPTSSYSGYYDASTVILARSDWNSLTVDEWVTFTLQYNAQPLEGKYTALKLCVADPDSPGIQGDMGGTGYSIKGSQGNINTNQNWFGNLITTVGNFFGGFFGFTGRATTDYLDNCLTLGNLHSDYANSTIKIAAHNATSGLVYDNNTLFDESNIKINYGASVSTQGSCPGSKTYCETEYSPDREISCEYTAEDADDTTVEYHVRVCDDESACSIWRQGTFYVNHLPYIDWVTIGTNQLSYADGLTYTSDVNDDWNLQCIMGQSHDGDELIGVTSDVIIDADGWTTPFANVENAKDISLEDGSILTSCSEDSNLKWIDVNDNDDYDYWIDTLVYNSSNIWKILLQYSNVTSGTKRQFTNTTNYNESNSTVNASSPDLLDDLFDFLINEKFVKDDNDDYNGTQDIWRDSDGVGGQVNIVDPTDTLLQNNSGSSSISTNATMTGTESGPFATEHNDTLNITYTVNGTEENCLVTLSNNLTNATITGTESSTFNTSTNYTLNLTFTKNGVEQDCDITFTQNDTLSINTVIRNVTDQCGNITATSAQQCAPLCINGFLKLTTQGVGMDEYINITGGNASGVLGFTTGVQYNGTDSISITNITSDINTACNLTATNSSNKVKLTVTGFGTDEYINVTGNATVPLGFTSGSKIYGTNGSNLTNIWGTVKHTGVLGFVSSQHIYDDVDGSDTVTIGDIRYFSDLIEGIQCYFHDVNADDDYDSGEDIIFDESMTNNQFDELINYTYSWYVKRYGEDEFSKCSDFDWCDNDGNDILTHGYTEPSDEWICEISPVDWRGVGTAKNSSTIHVTSATGATAPSVGGPEIVSITDNSDSSTYLDMGDEVEIDVTWDGPFDSVKLYVCNSSTFIDNGGCWDYEFNRSTSSENPIEVSFTVDESEGVFNITSTGQITYNIQLCSEDGDCNTGVGTFFVNHLPVVNSVSLLHYNGSEYISGSTANSSNNLNCTTNVTDVDSGSTIQKTYKWYKKSGSVWQLYWQQSSASANSSILSYTATELGEQWKCQVVPNDQHSSGVAVDSSTVTITQDSSSDTISITSLSDDSTASEPTNVGSDVTFEIAWSDATSSSATLYICNSSDILSTGCGYGTKEFVSTGWTTSNPITATYTVEASDYGMNYTATDSYIKYYALICNNDYNCSSVTTANYNFGANHIPQAQNVSIPNSGVNDDLLCNHTFYDLDDNASNGFAYNSSNYAGEENSYYSWERYINGQWVDQQINVDTIPDEYTSEGDTWRCAIIVNDGYANSTEVYSSSVNVGDVNPSIDSVTINSDSFNRLNYGELATFEIAWSDSTASETVDIYVCNSSSHNALGCLDTTFCDSGTLTTSPYSCDYNTSNFDETENNITYYVYIYDSSDNTDSYDSSANDNNIYMTELGTNSSVVLWELPDLTDTTPLNLIGYVNRDDISNTTVLVYAWRGYQAPNENTTNDLTSTSLEGTSTLEDDFDANSNYIVIDSVNYSYFNESNWLNFAGHNRTYFEKYNITARTDLEDGTYMVNISPNLTQAVSSGESVYAYNDSYPNGWFNVSLDLFERQNTIKSKIKKQTGSGNVTGSWSSAEYVYYDNENPSVNISRIGNYSNTLSSTLNFELTDNYAVDNDTFVFTVLNTSGGQNYGDRTSNVICTGSSSSWDCIGTPTLSNGTYNLTFSVNDTSNHSFTTTRENYVVNTTETQPTVTRTSAEYNTTNLTFEVFVPSHNLTGGTLQYAIGINYHPYTGWDNITSWVNLTNFTAGAEHIISSTIAGSNSTVNISTGNLNLTSGGIYVANVRYQLGGWEEVWGDVGYSNAMQYVPGTSSGSGPSSVLVTAPPFSTSPIITVSWTESTDDDYDISHYVVAVGNATYENTDWNTTSSGWLNVGNVLTSNIDMTLNSLDDEEEYYFTVAAVNSIGVKGTPVSSLGTTYFDYAPPIVTVDSVAGDSDSSDGWLDSGNDGDTEVVVSGDEDMICYYSLYDQDFIDFNNVTKEDEYCNYGSADDEVTCNIEDLAQADYTYYIICKDSLNNEQNRSQNTQVNFTIDWVDAPEVNVTVTITDGTSASNSGSSSYALTDDSLSCNYTATDPDGDDELLTASELSWIIDGEEVGSGTTIDLSNYGDAGDNIACQVTVTDSASLSTTANDTVYINNSVPTTTSLLAPSDNSYQTDSLLFNWTESTDADGDIVSYVINVFNSSSDLVMNQNATNDYYQRDITDESDWPEGAYDWNIKACDNSDYTNDCTDETSNYTFTIDNTVPFVNITSPTEGEVIGQLLNLYANLTDSSSGIDSATYELLDSDGESIADGIMVISGSQYYAQLVTLPFESGNYTINVTALDDVGNSASNTTNITIDLSAPKIQVDPDKWQFREQWLKDTVDINISINSSGTVFGSETNYSEISFTIEYSDGTVMDTGDTSSTDVVYSWNFSYDVSNWDDGRYDATFVATDNFSNSQTITTWFMVDKTNPSYANVEYSPEDPEENDSVVLSIDWQNNVFVWNANEFNLDQYNTIIQYTDNTSNASSYVNLTVDNDNLSINGNTFSGAIPSSYFSPAKVVYWRSTCYDLAGNTDTIDWQNFTITSTPPVFNETISDIEWLEDTTYANLTLSNHFFDPDDSISYDYTMFPVGTLFYEDFTNLTDAVSLNNATHENVSVSNQSNRMSLLIQADSDNLLSNADFGDSTTDDESVTIPNSWVRHSYPVYSHNAPPNLSYVTVNEHDYYAQVVEVTGGLNYTLSMYANTSDSGYGRMHINWFNSLYPSDDTTNKSVSYLSSTVDCDDRENCSGIISVATSGAILDNRERLTLVSPENAAYAQIILDSDSNSTDINIANVQFEQRHYASAFLDGDVDAGIFTVPAQASGVRDNINASQGTISMFVKPMWNSSDQIGDAVFFSVREDDGEDAFWIGRKDDEVVFAVDNFYYNVSLEVGSWDNEEDKFISARWNSTNLILDVGHTSTSGSISSFTVDDIEELTIYIGSDGDAENQANAYIDEIAIYDYVRTDAELNTANTQTNVVYLNTSYYSTDGEINTTINQTSSGVTFIPYANYTGHQRIKFRVNDSVNKMAGNMVDLYVLPVNDAPNTSTISNQSWWANAEETLTLGSHFTDVDGDELTYTSAGENNITISISSGVATFSQAVNWSGNETINFTAEDPSSLNATSNNVFLEVYWNKLYNTYVDGNEYDNSKVHQNSSLTDIYLSEINDSNITGVDVNLTSILSSTVLNSNVTNSTLDDCVIINSTVENADLENVNLTNGYIDPSNVTNSNITGNSNIIDSVVSGSVFEDSNSTNSTIIDSQLYDSFATNSQVYYLILRDANVTNNIICNGSMSHINDTLIYNATVSGCSNMSNLTNYPPVILSFTVTATDTTNAVVFTVDDLNYGSSGLNDNVSYVINWGQGTPTSGTTNNDSQITRSHAYTSSGTYTVTLTVTDEGGLTDSESGSGTVTVSGDGDDDGNGGGGSGGSSGGGTTTSTTDEGEEDEGAITSVQPSCYDNIKNQGEQGIDCGGPCGVCIVKASCYDNIKNQGEQGIDCGGPCGVCKVVEEPKSGFDYWTYIIALIIALVAAVGFILYKTKFMPPKRPKLETPKIEPKPVMEKEEVKQPKIEPKVMPVPAAVGKTQDPFKSLRNYITLKRGQKGSDSHIKHALMMSGWPEEVVDVALDGSKELEVKLDEVENYVKNAFSSGYKLENIKAALLEQDWSEGISDLLLFNVYKPNGNKKGLKEYVDYKVMQGRNLAEIKQILMSVGWEKGVIESII